MIEKGKKRVKEKQQLLKKGVRLVWESAPGWATANVIISILKSFFPLALVFLVKLLIDDLTRIVSDGMLPSSSNVILLIFALVVIYFLDEVSSETGNFIRKKQALKLEEHMYDLIHSKSIRIDLENFENPDYFDCLTRAAREAPWRPNSILNNSVSIFRGFLSLVLMAGLLATLSWWLALLMILVNIPAIWLRIHFAGVLYDYQRTHTPEARKASYFNWLLTGDRPARELRLFGLGNYFKSLFTISFKRQKEEEINIIRKRTLIDASSTLIKSLALLTALIFVAKETISGRFSLGEMAMLLLAFRQGMTYLREIFSSVASLYEDTLFIGDTFEFLGLEEKIMAVEPEAGPSPLSDRITVEDLSFSYPGNDSPTLSNISFEIRKGEIIAFVGHNGAGKTTLMKMLCRLYDPPSGKILWDGTDIRHIDPGKYRKMFSVVFQDFMLYNMSAGENIRLGNLEAGNHDDKIRSAAGMTGINGLIESLPSGYNTIIGNLFDESRELSWGEWQKIALARALFRDSPVLILDEPSSALDAETEYEIFSRFREIVRGKTSILISHRFTNVKLADRIYVIGGGTIKESGNHKDLLRLKGLYFDMYMKQKSRFGND